MPPAARADERLKVGDRDACHVTPDGRYILVKGRLWRRTNPNLPEQERQRLVDAMMEARRAIARIKRTGEGDLAAARAEIDRTKVALGERGPVWWTDGAPDYNRRTARNTPDRAWCDARADSET